MSWFALRALYLHTTEPGSLVYEERIVLYEAASAEAAFAQAEADSMRYLSLNPEFRRVGEWVCFDVHVTDGGFQGAEVWSGLLQSSLEPSEFYAKRYTEAEAPFLQEDADDEGP
jgi:hypothetical protein